MTKYYVVKTKVHVGWDNLFNKKRNKEVLDNIVWEKEMTIEEIEEMAINDYLDSVFTGIDDIKEDMVYIKEIKEELWSPVGSEECIYIKGDVKDD